MNQVMKSTQTANLHLFSCQVFIQLIESCSIDDGHSSENITFKMNFAFFKTLLWLFQSVENVKCRQIHSRGVDFLGTALKFKKRKNNLSSLVHPPPQPPRPPLKCEIRHFYITVMQGW